MSLNYLKSYLKSSTKTEADLVQASFSLFLTKFHSLKKRAFKEIVRNEYQKK